MKILLVAAYFPPLNRMASSRPASWAVHLAQAGHQVTVLTSKKHPYHGPLTLPLPELPEGTEVIELDYSLADKWGYGGKSSLRRILYGWQRLSWMLTATMHARRLSRTRRFDAIVSTYSPIAPIWLGYVAKRAHARSHWIVDYRDLWTGNPYRQRGAIAERVLESIQRWLLGRASLLTTISPPLQSALQKMVPQLAVAVVFNGYDQVASAPHNSLNDRESENNDRLIRIVYTGTIYPQKRDPEPLFQALRALADQQQIDLQRFQLCFLGDKLAGLPQLLHQYQLSHLAHLPGQVSREQSHQTQSQAALLLLLGADDAGVLPGKLFEYLAAGRPVLAIGDTPASDAGRLLHDAGCGLAVGRDVEQIKSVLLELYTGSRLSYFHPQSDVIAAYSRAAQARKLEELLLGLLKDI
ncbi:MAG: glycosyltransferase [Pirellulaceae bacterium]|nr:glycosyltransferase [Pirellulaceae bacterium]